MTQEQKDILFKDLCGRLSHGVKISVNDKVETLQGINILDTVVEYDSCLSSDIEEVKPYLFPLSSLTDEQKEELFFNYIHNDIYFDDFTDYFLAGELWHDICVSMNRLPELIDWLNKNHFDWRGLIPMGLAINATGKNIY